MEAGRNFDAYDESNRRPTRTPRPYLGVYFECCGVYARIYRRPEATRYAGRCPRCLRTLEVRVGPNGSQQRIFRAR